MKIQNATALVTGANCGISYVLVNTTACAVSSYAVTALNKKVRRDSS